MAVRDSSNPGVFKNAFAADIRNDHLAVHGTTAALRATVLESKNLPSGVAEAVAEGPKRLPQVPRRGQPVLAAADGFGVGAAPTAAPKIHGCAKRGPHPPLNASRSSVASTFKPAMAVGPRFDDIAAFVPRNATGGGAMIAPAGDRTRAGVMGQLGPVDMRVPYKGDTVSANSVLDADVLLGNRVFYVRPDGSSYPEGRTVDSPDPVIPAEMSDTAMTGRERLYGIPAGTGYPRGLRERAGDMPAFSFRARGFAVSRSAAGETGIAAGNRNADAEGREMTGKRFPRCTGLAADRHFVRFVAPKKREG